MSFKIIQTIEEGKLCLSVVPSSWEKDGTLLSKQPCIVKRTSLANYEEATRELAVIQEQTDREEAEASLSYKRKRTGPDVLQNSSFDNETFANIIEGQNKILDLLEKNCEMQTKIMNELAKHKQHLSDLSNSVNNLQADVGSHKTVEDKDKQESQRFPTVTSVEELNALEENLKIKSFEQKYIKSMSSLCSPGVRGLTACYKIIDFFITRELMFECSWTGNSRGNGNPNEKIAFKFYNRIRLTFFEVVHKIDPSFSMVDVDQFFKKIIKNSRQRLQSKNNYSSISNNIKSESYVSNDEDSADSDTTM